MAHTAFAKAGGEGVQGLHHLFLKLLDSEFRRAIPWITHLLCLSIQFLSKAHVQEATLIFPWKEREYGSPPCSGGKEKFSSPEDSPEIQQGKGSQ